MQGQAATVTPTAAAPFSPYQRGVIGLLAFLQFTIILDFMIISPLGAMLMPMLHITPAQFGVVVSAYAFSAGASGLLAAGFTDRFDRKTLLLVFYGGFVLGTLLCGVARTYEFLFFARMITGVFAGVIGSTVMAITTDLFDYGSRGRVMGIIQAAFSASSVIGIPLGLYLSNRWGWNAPFLLIVAISAAVGLAAWRLLRPIDAHLKIPSQRTALRHFIHTATMPRYLGGFVTTALLSTGGFLLMPYSSAFSVHNLGIALTRLPLVYIVTGACTLVAGPLIGRASDSFGKFRLFCFGSAATLITVTVYTHLGPTPIGWVILINCLLFIGITSRMISASALLSAVPAPADRGAYMSISSSLQQVSGGFAAIVAGVIVTETSTGALEHFDTVGYVLAVTILITTTLMYFISRRIEATVSAPATTAPAYSPSGTGPTRARP